VSDVIGTERNVVRVRVPESSVSASERALAEVKAVKHVANANGSSGWLRVQLDEMTLGDEQINNQLLDALIRAGIPVLSYEPEGGRLQDVFLHLTGGSTR
jgi:uncharacterized membrane protein affecting hemolysin expression